MTIKKPYSVTVDNQSFISHMAKYAWCRSQGLRYGDYETELPKSGEDDARWRGKCIWKFSDEADAIAFKLKYGNSQDICS